MRHQRVLVLVIVLFACGPQARENKQPIPGDVVCEPSPPTCASTTSVQICDQGQLFTTACAENEQCKAGACEPCPTLHFSINTTQSCALGVPPGSTLDGEAFINVNGQDHRVLALNRWGMGHILAWCDWSSIAQLFADFDVFKYVAQMDNPRVASFGAVECDPHHVSVCLEPPDTCVALPANVTYLGQDLPANYIGNPNALAADWDALVFCGFNVPWTHDWSSEIATFVKEKGKGFVAIGEYDTYAKPADFPNMTKITQDAGVIFEQINIDWAVATSNVTLACVPDVEPVE